MKLTLTPIPADEAPFEERQLRQPTAEPPRITDPEAVDTAKRWLVANAETVEQKHVADGCRDALADRYCPNEGDAVCIWVEELQAGVIVSRFSRRGSIPASKLIPHLSPGVDAELFRGQTVEVVSARRA